MLPSSPAALVQSTHALVQSTHALQEALGSLAQRALCSADPAAVGEAAALVARLREIVVPYEKHR